LFAQKNKNKKLLINTITKLEVSGAANCYIGFNPVFDAIDKRIIVSGQYSGSL
jgi:hypothetical protein